MKLKIDLHNKLIIRRGIIESTDNSNFGVKIKDNTIKIFNKYNGSNVFNKYSIMELLKDTSKRITNISVSSSRNIVIEDDTLFSENLIVKMSGSGKIIVNNLFVTDNLLAKITGSSDFVFNNLKIDLLKAKITGSGNIRLDDSKIKEAVFKLSGSGKILGKNTVIFDITDKITGSGGIFIESNNKEKSETEKMLDKILEDNKILEKDNTSDFFDEDNEVYKDEEDSIDNKETKKKFHIL